MSISAARANQSDGTKITFVTSNYAPYAIDLNSKAEGLIPDVLATMYDSSAYEILFVPWKRAELMIENGEAFAAFPYGINEERKARFWFSAPLVDFKPSVFYLKRRNPRGISWRFFEDLVSYEFVGVRGYQANTMLEEQGIVLHRVSAELHAFQFLLFERADMTLMDNRVGWHVIQKHLANNQGEFDSASSDEFIGTYFLMASKRYPNAEQLLKNFNKNLSELKTSGLYEDIMRMYGQQHQTSSHLHD